MPTETRWGSLGLGRRGVTPPKYDLEAFLERMGEITGPSLASRMADLDRMQRERFERGERGPAPPGSPEATAGLDVASNFEMTGRLGPARRFSVPEFMRGNIGEIVTGKDIPGLVEKNIPPVGDFFGDLSRLGDIETYPKGLTPPREMVRPRVPPKAGVPENISELLTPENADRMRGELVEGLKIGGGEWYNTAPFRQKFVDALGEEEGDRRWRTTIQAIAASSPRSNVPQNIRAATFYANKLLRGEGVPDPVENSRIGAMRRELSGEADYDRTVEIAKAAGNPIPKKPKFKEAGEDWPALPVPTPYAHKYQISHMKNMQDIAETGQIKKPLKAASFAENLLGHLDPLTEDVHFMEWFGAKDPKTGKYLELPPEGAYGTIEDWFRENVADPVGVPSAIGQASGWLGQAATTGVRSPIEPVTATIERLIGRTADLLGVSKDRVWEDVFIKNKYPLLGVGGPAAALGLGGGGGRDDEDGS